MRLLFEINSNDYNPNGKAFIRPSVRSIIIKNEKVAMVHSLKYDYYKFPGGGIEPGENQIEALIRETAEESGLIIIPQEIYEYGYVHRIQKGLEEEIFIQDNYYYLCNINEKTQNQVLDDYEADEQFTLEWVNPWKAIKINRTRAHHLKDKNMLEREARVLECLISDKYFTSDHYHN